MSNKNKKLIEDFLIRQGAKYQASDNEPMVLAMEEAIGHRLPSLYRQLIAGYEFYDIITETTNLWGALGEFEEDEELRSPESPHLAARITRDPYLFPPLLNAGYVQIGRPELGAFYDPLCIRFDKADSPVVRMDHEWCLIHAKVVVIEAVAPSFRAFLQA